MLSWIPVLISVFALLISVVAQRDKLLSFFDDLKKRIVANNEKKKALAIINRFANPDAKKQPSLLAFYIPIFLISVISSGSLKYIGNQTNFYNTILLSAVVYLSISMIVLITFLATSRRFEFWFVVSLFIAVLMVSALWGIFVIIAETAGLRMMWSGIVAGIFIILWLLYSDLHETRKA